MKRLSLAGIILLITAVFFAPDTQAQDIHFSQFYASPLTLNPALTGKMNGSYRIGGIYRDQWRSVASPFITYSASFDMPFVVGKKKVDAVGGGIMFFGDQSNGGALKNTTIMLSAAYHKGLGAKNNHQLSIGVQGGFVTRAADPDEVIFGEQIVNGQVDQTLQNGESFENTNINYPDFNVGLFYNGQLSQKLVLYAGWSMFHLFQPEESFLGGDFKLPSRQVAHGGLDILVKPKFSILPGVIYMHQAQASEVNFGSNFGFHFGEGPGMGTSLYLGGWYRWDDAAIAMAAVEFGKFRIGASYDINVTEDANNGSFEVSLIYVGDILKADKVFLFCPRY